MMRSFTRLAVVLILAASPLARSDESLVGYWDFETTSGAPVADGQGAYGISPLDRSLPQPLAHYNFETSGAPRSPMGKARWEKSTIPPAIPMDPSTASRWTPPR